MEEFIRYALDQGQWLEVEVHYIWGNVYHRHTGAIIIWETHEI